MADRRYYLGPWIRRIVPGDPRLRWKRPDGCRAAIDFRSRPQHSIASPASGLGLFALDHEFINDDYDLIARTPDEMIRSDVRTRFASRIGKQITQTRLDRIIYELLTLRADPTGEDFARPLIPTMARNLEIHLGGQIFNRPWRHDLAEMSAMMQQVREHYRDHRQQVLDGVMPPNHHRRILDFNQKKYRIDWRLLKPDDLPDEEPIQHDTTITESFNTADSDTLGPDLSWTEVFGDFNIVTNRAQATAGSRARADSDLSSDDHYAQAVTVGGNQSGTMARYSSSADTAYYVFRRNNDHALQKVVAGSTTAITTGGTSVASPIKLEVNGSTIKTYANGVEQISTTDSSITGNVRCGIRGNNGAILDDFEAADLAAADPEGLLVDGKLVSGILSGRLVA